MAHKEELDDIEESGVKPPKMSRSDLYKPPTSEEYRGLRETNMLFHSNLIRLQITETLKEISLREKHFSKVNKFCDILRETILKIPPTENVPLQDASWLDASVHCPIIMTLRANATAHVQYLPPVDIKVVGSYDLDMTLKQQLNVDLLLVMPKECFHRKREFLNHQYFRKRAMYLAHVAYHLAESDLPCQVEFSYFLEDLMKPVVHISPSDTSGILPCTVCIHACPAEGVFRFNRFLCSTNNVRPDWFNSDSNEQQAKVMPETEESLLPTPHHNMMFLIDLEMESHHNYIHETLGDHTAFKDAVRLLKTWLKQRELDQGYGCFNGFLMTMFIAKLLKSGKISRAMSSYQIVRNVFSNLATTNWKVEGCVFDKSHATEDFHKHFEVVFLSPTGRLNLCANMSACLYDQAKHEAEISLASLDNLHIGFNAVFMESVSFSQKFDRILHFSKPILLKKTSSRAEVKDRLCDHAGNHVTAALPHVASMLRRGLDNRVLLLGVKPHHYNKWPISSPPPSWKDIGGPLSFGLLLNNDNANNVLHKGPPADSPEAKAFRNFWGKMSELRRFKDSSICEAVVWDCDSMAEQRNVIEKICQHLLDRHCGIPPSTVSITSLDSMLSFPLRSLPGGASVGYSGIGDEVHQEAIKASNELFQDLRNLSSLPLSITNIQGVSPVLRYTEVFPSISRSNISDFLPVVPFSRQDVQVPVPDQPCPTFVAPIEVVCHLEGSGKWPDDVEALRRLKAAFHIAICEELKSAGHHVVSYPTANYFLVVKFGFVFRVNVGYHRELTILQTHRSEDGKIFTRKTPESVALAKSSIQLPYLASSLHGLQQKYQSFGNTCRLAKLWVASHLLSSHLSEEATELMCAHVFTAPHPFTPPGSSQTGFLRFLKLLAAFDFASTPLIVDVQESLRDESRASMTSYFNANRDVLPHMCIMTSKDRKRSIWTEEGPSKMVGRRIKGLAQVAAKSLTQMLESGWRKVDITAFLKPSLAHYDVVIRLKPQWCPRQVEARGDDGGGDDDTSILPVVDFDPVRAYVTKLKEIFNEFALFFYNQFQGSVVGVLWRPHVFEPTSFKMVDLSCKSLTHDGKTLPNIPAIIEDFQVLGLGLVESVNLRSDKWKL